MSINYTTLPFDMHLRLTVSGVPARVALFHEIMYAIDVCWPWDSRGLRLPTGHARICCACSGHPVSRPRFNPSDIKAAARQAGVRVKTRYFGREDRCRRNGQSPAYTITKSRTFSDTPAPATVAGLSPATSTALVAVTTPPTDAPPAPAAPAAPRIDTTPHIIRPTPAPAPAPTDNPDDLPWETAWSHNWTPLVN